MLLWWSTKYPCGGQVTNYKKDLQKWPWNGYGDKHELVDGGKVVNFFVSHGGRVVGVYRCVVIAESAETRV
jgi:hypothetical protein